MRMEPESMKYEELERRRLAQRDRELDLWEKELELRKRELKDRQAEKTSASDALTGLMALLLMGSAMNAGTDPKTDEDEDSAERKEGANKKVVWPGWDTEGMDKYFKNMRRVSYRPSGDPGPRWP